MWGGSRKEWLPHPCARTQVSTCPTQIGPEESTGTREMGSDANLHLQTNHPLHRLPPGYYPYLGQMPGPREPNRGGGPDQGYGQGGYNSLNRGNQVAVGGNMNVHVLLQIIRVGGQDLGPGLRAQYPPQPGDGGCVVRSVSVT